jgi:copper chaperone CopZ
MSTSTVVILLVLAIVVILAIRSSVKHLKGQGGCCGGDSSPSVTPKRLDAPIVSTLVITIKGMHCKNCKNRIEKTINAIDGVACEVDLKENTATVTMCKPVDMTYIKDTIEGLDFKVIGIQTDVKM